ncbi:DUF11 domain-containing protein [Streptomyces sp. ISL-100]|nr:DUF11 domain-containing protein [Streptomyces sp. ISL-100]
MSVSLFISGLRRTLGRAGEQACRRRVGRAGVAASAGFALVLALPGSAAAAPGDLDATFGGGDGKVISDVLYVEDSQDVALQSDGKIVTIGSGFNFDGPNDFVLIRYNTDGTVDTGFGAGGTVLVDFGDLTNDEGQDVAVQSDGKIVAVGRSDAPDGRGLFALARFNTDGSLDTTFGDGGKVVTDFGTGGSAAAYAVAVQSGGGIVAAGGLNGDFVVARFNADGSPDTGFGDNGAVRTPFARGGASVFDLAVQSDGTIVAAGHAGYVPNDYAPDFALARYNADGSLDTGFGGDGTVTTSFNGEDTARGVAVQSDGRIIAVGNGAGDFALARYNVDGSLDTSFDGDGKVTTDFGTFDARAFDMALQSDGKVVAAGGAVGNWAVARYNTNGSLDTGFGGGDGKVTTDFEGNWDEARGVALQSDGKIVVSGNASDNHAVARYLGAGGSTPPPPAGVDVSVTKSGTSTVSIGDRATYTVRVTNTDDDTFATGVSLTDSVAGAVATLVSAMPSQGTCTTTTTVSCSLDSLAPGASATVTVVAEPRSTGTLTNTARADAAETDPVTVNDTATATTTVNNSRGCTIIGTSAANTITGTSGNDVICGLGGNDTIRAANGYDTVYGNYGNDWIDGGYGNDTLNGGYGSDTLNGSYGNDRLNTVDNVSGNDTANGGPNSDTCTTDPGDTRTSCP